MKTVICEKDRLARTAAAHIKRTLADKPDAVIAMSAGRTMDGLWQQLAGLCKAGEISFRDARVLLTAERLCTEEKHRCRHALCRCLLEKTDIAPQNCFFPDETAPEKYDELIESLGGLDLAVLGIGENGHIGYNEPGTLFDTHTRLQKLTDRTKRQLYGRGFTDADMPEYAVTMGIRTLFSARDIAVIAAGTEKSAAVFQMLYSKTISYIPASFLQIPLNVTAYLDTEAASQL